MRNVTLAILADHCQTMNFLATEWTDTGAHKQLIAGQFLLVKQRTNPRVESINFENDYFGM